MALAAAQAVGFGLAGLVLNGQTGTAGMAGFIVVVAISLGLTAVFLAIAAMIAQTSAERRARVLGLAVVIWFAAVVSTTLPCSAPPRFSARARRRAS